MRALLLLLCLAPPSAGADVTLSLRGGGTSTIASPSISGAGIAGEFEGAPVVLTWDRVRDLQGTDDAQAKDHLAAGESLWRGLARLDRGDHVAAVALLEQAFEHFSEFDGATASVAADGLLAARLRQAETEAAVEPWLVRVQQDSQLLEVPVNRRATVDEATGLVPSLPPVFVGSRASASRAAILAGEGFERWTEGPIRRQAELYATAMLLGAGQEPPGFADDVAHPGVHLVWAMVEARMDDPARREAGRRALRSMLEDTEQPWIRAWCHAAIGLSLLSETEAERLAGVGHLLVVPSRFSDEQPYLAGLCLAEAARAMFEAGRSEAALELALDLEVQFPRHPSLSLPHIRALFSLGEPGPRSTGPNS